ncbi:LysR family transcriptional regulator [Nocardioidaceae bacterium SCSIO 66511]|nr:LysR family transcriptional regulator [Nocardioidaceae bacterium SCSIO 66511]
MRVEQLEHLVGVTQNGSLRRAGERLHLSQPALSESLSRLERELGVLLLDRRRSGTRISEQGLELLPYVEAVLEAVDRLRGAAGERREEGRVIRVGTVSAATSTLLTPSLRELASRHPSSRVEVVNTRQNVIDDGLLGGGLDLGLVNVFAGDDPPAGLVDLALISGPVVAVLPGDHRLVDSASVGVDDLRAEPFVSMREGYIMHRLATRMFGDDWPRAYASTDGAELGKAMVADGAGLTVLPQYSVDGDALHRSGAIVHRPIEGVDVEVSLVLRLRRTARVPAQLAVLRDILLARTAELSGRIGSRSA